jgi:hypothetical protein
VGKTGNLVYNAPLSMNKEQNHKKGEITNIAICFGARGSLGAFSSLEEGVFKVVVHGVV